MSEATIDSMMGALQRLKDVRIWLTIFGQRERGLIMPYANQRLAERRGQQQLEEIQVGSQQANSTPAALREESPSPRHRVWINLSYASYKPLFYPSSLIHVQSDFNNHNHFSCIVTHPEVRCFGTLEMSCLWWTYALRFPPPRSFAYTGPCFSASLISGSVSPRRVTYEGNWMSTVPCSSATNIIRRCEKASQTNIRVECQK